jgi:hypothetical protein
MYVLYITKTYIPLVDYLTEFLVYTYLILANWDNDYQNYER